jgi:hypothetical protein
MSVAGSVSSGRSKLRKEAEALAGWSQQKFAVGGSVNHGGHPPQFASDIDLNIDDVRVSTGMIDMLGSSFHSLTYFEDESNDFQENLERFSKESKDKQNKKLAKGSIPMARQWSLIIVVALLFIGATAGTVVGVLMLQRSDQGSDRNIVTDSGDDYLAATSAASPSECSDVSTNPYLQCKCGQESVSSVLPETEEAFSALLQYFSLGQDVLPRTAVMRCDNPYAVALWWIAMTGNYNDDVTTITQFVLALMYLSLDGPNWLSSTGWMSFDVAVCDWSGVICRGESNEDYVVEELMFKQMGLSGSLPSEIGLLQSLVGLTLSNNLLYGKLPSDVLNMKDLRKLSLEKNSLEGTLPDPTSLPNLQILTMGYNKFSGRLPNSLGEWKNMQELTLEGNYFSGTLPTTVASMTKVSYIDLGENALTGPIPDMSAMTSLKWLVLEGNQFTGTLSENLPSTIETLDLASNHLEGTLPSSYGQLSMLSVLSLGSNSLTGTVPTEFGSMKLDYLNLSFCQLTGTIPTELGLLSRIGVLNVASNSLEGSVPEEVCKLTANKLQELKVNCAVHCECCIGACEGRR